MAAIAIDQLLFNSSPINDQSIRALFQRAIQEGGSITITAALFKVSTPPSGRVCRVDYRTEGSNGPYKSRSAREAAGSSDVKPENVMEFGFDVVSMQWADPATVRSGGGQITGWGNGFTSAYFEAASKMLQLGQKLHVDGRSMPPPAGYTGYGPPMAAAEGKLCRVVVALAPAYGGAKVADFEDAKYEPLLIQEGWRAGWKRAMLEAPCNGDLQRSFPGNAVDPALGLTDKPY